MGEPSLDDPMFGPKPFPEKFLGGFRPYQWDAITATRETFDSGNSVVFLQAPTGSGKTFIADVVRRLLVGDMVYMCTTKELQDQVVGDFPYANVVKGRSNYLTLMGKLDSFGNPTPRARYSEITCADCTYNPDSGCRWCGTDYGNCPYQRAANAAQYGPFAVLNTSYFLTETNLANGRFKGRKLVVVDEADKLESVLMGYAEARIPPKDVLTYGLELPKVATEDAKSNDWLEWVTDEAIPKVQSYHATLTPPWSEGADAEALRTYRKVENLLGDLGRLRDELPNKGWVLDGRDDGGVTFKPVMVARYGARLMWPHGRKFLLMSATVLSADLMANELGITNNRNYAMVEMPSTIPVEQRPVYVCNVASMTFDTERESYPKMAEGVRKVLELHPNDRVLVHTVSYKLADYLHRQLSSYDSVASSRPLLVYRSAREKEGVLAEYRRSNGAVLFASSMGRGVDLPGDLCRVQVIAKVPFPNRGDKQIKARMWAKGGTLWYRMQAIRELIQMCGRAVRGPKDWAVTYILDEQFQLNLMKSKHLFPRYFREALFWRKL